MDTRRQRRWKKIWRFALEQDPDNEVLLETLQRFIKKKEVD